MRHLLVTNDFPPKVGGIQAYLWELWRRLPAEDVTVLTTPHPDSRTWDAAQPFRVVRTKQKWLLPTKALVNQIEALSREVGAKAVVLDPVLPLGLVGPKLSLPYAVVGHGAELAIPSAIPGLAGLGRSVVGGAQLAIASGEYVAEPLRRLGAHRTVKTTVVPPGVDVSSFRAPSAQERIQARASFGLSDSTVLIGGVSRLVPRKGFDRLIKAASILQSQGLDVQVLIAGKGRDRSRLERLISRCSAPVKLLGRLSDEDLRRLFCAMDIFSMPCHDRWFGLEQEGFGIVFVEASACGLPVVAGASGGSGEAVAHGETGFVVQSPVDPKDLASSLGRLVRDPELRSKMGRAGRLRMEAEFDYDLLADRLKVSLERLCQYA